MEEQVVYVGLCEVVYNKKKVSMSVLGFRAISYPYSRKRVNTRKDQVDIPMATAGASRSLIGSIMSG